MRKLRFGLLAAVAAVGLVAWGAWLAAHLQPILLPRHDARDLGAPTRMLVVAGHSRAMSSGSRSQDLSWILFEVPDLCTLVYDHGEPRDEAWQPLLLTPNAGKEGHAYLEFIVFHYHNLPLRTAFIHGHRSSYHSVYDMPVLLRYLRWELPYATLNSGGRWRIGRAEHGGVQSDYEAIAAAWPSVFQPWFGDIPPYFDTRCCAQFMAGRDNIRAVPLAFWERYLEFAKTGNLASGSEQPSESRLHDDAVTKIIEQMWPFVMTRGSWRHEPSNEAFGPDAPVTAECHAQGVLSVRGVPGRSPACTASVLRRLGSGHACQWRRLGCRSHGRIPVRAA